MSAKNGGKARFHSQRKSKIRARVRNRARRQALLEKLSPAKPAAA